MSWTDRIPEFDKHLHNAIALFHELDACAPLGFTDPLPAEPGVYAFLESGTVERIGRSNNIRKRLRTHLRQDHNSGSYAFKRARQKFGTKATYRKGFGRMELQRDPEFAPLFAAEIERLRKLQIKYATVESAVEQYLLEIYAAMHYGLDLDEFGNH